MLSHTHHQASREDESTTTYTSILLIAKYCTTAVPEVARVEKCPSKAFPLLRVLFALFLCVDSVTAESYGLMYFRNVLFINIIYSYPSVCLFTLLVHVSYFILFWLPLKPVLYLNHLELTSVDLLVTCPVCAKLVSL